MLGTELLETLLASIRGYSEARLLVFDLEAGEIFGNRAAKEMVKGYRKAGILKIWIFRPLRALRTH